jgi:hypothetical protein
MSPLRATLEAAIDGLNGALGDMMEGRIQPAEFQRRALTAGVIFLDDGLLMWDWRLRAWHYYDGIEIRRAEV